jgi:hypothetical protein
MSNFTEKLMKCGSCGRQLNNGELKCSKCGKLNIKPIIAAILFFGGGLLAVIIINLSDSQVETQQTSQQMVTSKRANPICFQNDSEYIKCLKFVADYYHEVEGRCGIEEFGALFMFELLFDEKATNMKKSTIEGAYMAIREFGVDSILRCKSESTKLAKQMDSMDASYKKVLKKIKVNKINELKKNTKPLSSPMSELIVGKWNEVDADSKHEVHITNRTRQSYIDGKKDGVLVSIVNLQKLSDREIELIVSYDKERKDIYKSNFYFISDNVMLSLGKYTNYIYERMN